jgi:RNA polymerase sigma factor (sigma-70 family)
VSNTSFENLVNEHGGQVLRTAMRVLREANLAHDVHQEVFLSIWRRWSSYNGSVNWPAYLYRVTLRKALDQARRRTVRTGLKPARTEVHGPDAELRADELQQRLAAALAKLPPRQADAFVLSRLEGLEAAEIARVMGCSVETVRVHLHRAIARLAHELRGYLDA